MDFKAQEMNFQEADRHYAHLKQQRDAGAISDEEFEAQRQRLMLLDGDGRWWAKSRDSGDWRYHDGNTWVPGTPPGYREEAATTASSPVQAPPAPRSTGGRRRRMPLWIPIVGLGGLALIAIVIFGWVFVPSVRDFISSYTSQLGQSEQPQGEQPQDDEGGDASSGSNEPASEGVAFDAVFVHTATPDNISANSTYLDNPLTNNDPNVIVQVTQNWNPGGEGGTYNDHEIGVWYDGSRDQWAIFNQDREAMTEGAQFNVGVMKEAQQE